MNTLALISKMRRLREKERERVIEMRREQVLTNNLLEAEIRLFLHVSLLIPELPSLF